MMLTLSDIAWLVKIEGGYNGNNPNDLGGPTKYGITAATLGRARELSRAATPEEVQNLEVDEATEIYRRDFVLKPKLDLIESRALAMFLFDSCVQFGGGDVSGGWEGIEWLQEAIGGLKVDGLLGPKTLSAIKGFEPHSMVLEVAGLRLAKRRRVIRKHPAQLANIAGWLLRDSELLKYVSYL
jgi:lysozyme family protein